DVDELRRTGEARGLDSSNQILQTPAERIGFMFADTRAMGLDETEQLEFVELVLRAADVDRQDLREARDTLKALNYSPDLIRLLTALARKAPAKPVYFTPGQACSHAAVPHQEPSNKVDHRALAAAMRSTKRRAPIRH